MKQPDEIGGAETQSCYLVVGDADAHYRTAKAAGAEILLHVDDDDHGGAAIRAATSRGTFGASAHTIPGKASRRR